MRKPRDLTASSSRTRGSNQTWKNTALKFQRFFQLWTAHVSLGTQSEYAVLAGQFLHVYYADTRATIIQLISAHLGINLALEEPTKPVSVQIWQVARTVDMLRDLRARCSPPYCKMPHGVSGPASAQDAWPLDEGQEYSPVAKQTMSVIASAYMIICVWPENISQLSSLDLVSVSGRSTGGMYTVYRVGCGRCRH